MGTHGGAPQRTSLRCTLRSLRRLRGPRLSLLAPQLQTRPARSWACSPHAPGSRGAGERRPRTCLRRADALLRDAPGARRLAWLAAHHQRGGPAPSRRAGTSSAAVPGGGGDSGGKPREAALEVLGAGEQKRAWPQETGSFRLSLPQPGGLRFLAPDTPRPRPQPSRPGSHSSSGPAEAARSGIWKPPFLGPVGLPGLPSRGAGSPGWTPRSASGRS